MDLNGAELARTNLSGVNLRGANLSGADLSGANLSGADVAGNLSDAHLSGANLNGANFNGADLCGAELMGANLSRANLSNGPSSSRSTLVGPSERLPASRSACFTQWKSTVRSARTHVPTRRACVRSAPDRPSVAETAADNRFGNAAWNTSKIKFKGVHKTGPNWLHACLPRDAASE